MPAGYFTGKETLFILSVKVMQIKTEVHRDLAALLTEM